MRIKTMIISALAALAITGAFASIASAENGIFWTSPTGQQVPAHIVQTPTGPMKVADSLVEVNADGSGVIGTACNYLPQARRDLYTWAEVESDIRGYCFEAPGTVPINPAELQMVRAAEKQAHQQARQQKRQHAQKHGRH